jgi:ATP-dependent DNA helicase DinG
MSSSNRVFGKDGLLSKKLSGYESRPSQEEYSNSVESALRGGYNLAIEGPCGTGKSVAYLVPAIRAIVDARRVEHNSEGESDNNHVVIATASILLQEQLVFKDLPFLESIIPEKFTFALVKGRNNYLCLEGLYDWKMEIAKKHMPWGGNPDDIDILPFIKDVQERKMFEWSKVTTVGDKNELDFVPSEETWWKFSKTAEDCIGQKCAFHDDCFANRAKVALQSIDVIVANYHMLFASVAFKRQAGIDAVLPPHKYLILDEAHRLADIAREFFGWNVSEGGLLGVVTSFVKNMGSVIEDSDKFIKKANESVDLFAESLTELYGTSIGKFRLKEVTAAKIALNSVLLILQDMASSCEEFLPVIENPNTKAKVEKIGDRCTKYSNHLNELNSFLESSDNAVFYLEPYGKHKRIRIVKEFLDIGKMLWDEMYSNVDSAIATSATMAIDGDCGYICREIGMLKGTAVVVDSPFNFNEQAMIILSDRAPDPTKENYPQKVAEICKEVIKQAKGRTLCLFTSYKVLNHVSEYLRMDDNDLGYTILTQGDLPRMKLIEQFKADVSSVLLGTDSFWTGVDIPGESLSALIIDKIPFPNPKDPVLEALSEKVDGNGFWKVSLPRAVLQLRQGTGRLIRRRDDRGVCVILDCRLVTKGYGNIFVGSLPNMRRSQSMRNGTIEKFLGGK